MGRKGENVRQRKDGRWEARGICGYNDANKAIYHSFYGNSYAEAKRKRAEYLKQLKSQKNEEETERKEIRYSMLLDRFLTDIETKVKLSTLNRYKEIIQNHIKPNLGSFLLSDLNSLQIDRFTKDRLAHGRVDRSGGLSARTVRSILSLVNLTISYGKECGYTVSEAYRIHTPRTTQTGAKAFASEDQKTLEAWLNDNPGLISLGIWLSLYTGLRLGEVCALQWKHADLDKKTLIVNQKAIYGSNLKNAEKLEIIDCPDRSVPLPDFLCDLLATNRQDNDCFILSGAEDILLPVTFKNSYQTILKNLHLEKYDFYSLGQTFISNSLNEGADIANLYAVMGR